MPALDKEDIDLLLRWAGSVLLGVNYAQRFAILEGTSGSGKSTFVGVLEAIIGERNLAQLRTRHLGDRFEIGRFVGKIFLGGKDVRGNFLEEKGAEVIKCLVADDNLTAEIKGSMASPLVPGIFGVGHHMQQPVESAARRRLRGVAAADSAASLHKAETQTPY